LLMPLAAAGHLEASLIDVDAGERLQWTRYTVRRGDSLSGIAARFNTEAAVIREVNNLRGNRIIAGDGLLIPTASAPAQRYALSADQRQKKKQSGGDGHRRDYQVQPGDSFWTIARRFDVSTRQLAEWNGLAVRDPIHPGQKLVVWMDKPESAPVQVTQVAVALSEREPMVRKLGYRVRSGDSLARIAGKFNISIDDILEWNDKLRGKKYIHPGQQLTLYVDITNN
jgi:membrane-bound lytic murein transglycosylase D